MEEIMDWEDLHGAFGSAENLTAVARIYAHACSNRGESPSNAHLGQRPEQSRKS